MSTRMLLTAAILCAMPAFAAQPGPQNYPTKPIRLLIPFAPGGATDIIARMIEPKMSRTLGQQIVVDNRPGAAGNISVELAAHAQADGYTMLVGNISTNSINPILFARQMKVNAVKDLTGVTKLVAIPNFILGSPKLPAHTLKEAIEYAKSRPGQLNYQAPLGSYSHLDMLAFTAAAGIRMVHLPSRGAGETLPALLPQVYLHYDPAVVKTLRHRLPLPRQRMDFLLLLPGRQRIVLEVDGKHHFSEDDQPPIRVYADMVSGDRELRLAGSEVYRFGANELDGNGAEARIADFFEKLFRLHRVRQ